MPGEGTEGIVGAEETPGPAAHRTTLLALEAEIERHLAQSTFSYLDAIRLIEDIRDERLWEGAVDAHGETYRSFEHYLKDFIARLKDRQPYLPVSRSTILYHLKWLRRARNLGIATEQMIQVSPSVMNRFNRATRWDEESGKLLEVDESLLNMDVLPEGDTPEARVEEFIRDLAYAPPKDALRMAKLAFREISDHFLYTVAFWDNRLTVLRANMVTYVDGRATSSRWYDLLYGTDRLPKELIDDLTSRLDAYPIEDNTRAYDEALLGDDAGSHRQEQDD